MFVVDTNVLLYAVNIEAPESDRCVEQLERWANGTEPWHLTWGTIYEFLRAATHPVFEAPLSAADAWEFLARLIQSPSLEMLQETDRHVAVLGEVLREVPDARGTQLFDIRLAVLMREHGIRTVVTRDRDFRRFPFLEVVDPLA